MNVGWTSSSTTRARRDFRLLVCLELNFNSQREFDWHRSLTNLVSIPLPCPDVGNIERKRLFAVLRAGGDPAESLSGAGRACGGAGQGKSFARAAMPCDAPAKPKLLTRKRSLKFLSTKALVVHARLVTRENETRFLRELTRPVKGFCVVLCCEQLDKCWSRVVPQHHPIHIHCFGDSLEHAQDPLLHRWMGSCTGDARKGLVQTFQHSLHPESQRCLPEELISHYPRLRIGFTGAITFSDPPGWSCT